MTKGPSTTAGPSTARFAYATRSAQDDRLVGDAQDDRSERWWCLAAEDAGEDGVDVGELAGVVEGGGELRGRQAGGDGGVAGDFVAEGEAFLPGVHRVGLNEAVGVFAGHAGGAEVEERSEERGAG